MNSDEAPTIESDTTNKENIEQPNHILKNTSEDKLKLSRNSMALEISKFRHRTIGSSTIRNLWKALIEPAQENSSSNENK